MKRFRRRTRLTISPYVLAPAAILGVLTWPSASRAAIVLAQEEDLKSHITARAPSDEIAIDNEKFELHFPARDDDTPGILKYAGYAQQVIVRQSTYRSKSGGATVEVIDHPASYPYVKHDVLGTFYHALHEQKNNAGLDAGEIVIPIEYVDWQTVESQEAHVICVLSIRLNGAYHGIAGWYSESEGRTSTVMLRFGAPTGLPRALIDDYLKKYPSSIKGTVASLDSWEADDITKWVDLLQTRASDEAVLNLARIHLRRYDAGAFGLTEAWKERGDAAALAEEISATTARMQTWLEDHQKAKGRHGGP